MGALNELSQIIGVVIVILAIFGILYMLTDMIRGFAIIMFCGVLMFARAFIKKRS